MEQQEREQIKARIAELRARYARLRSFCGPRHINRATAEEYARELQRLEGMLK